MAAPKPFRLIQSSYLLPRQASASFFPLPNLCPRRKQAILIRSRPRLCVTVCVLMEDKKQSAAQPENPPAIIPDNVDPQISQRVAEKLARKRSERFTYLVAAVMSSFGITSMAVMAVYYRFYWQMEVATFSFSLSLSPQSLAILSSLFLSLTINFLLGRVERFLTLKCSAHLLYPLVLL